MNTMSRLLWSIRNRDWGSAVIEIFVVAVGILMALAVDNWRTQVEEGKKEHEILKRSTPASSTRISGVKIQHSAEARGPRYTL